MRSPPTKIQRNPLTKTLRRLFQFRLRTALAFMVLCSLAANWLGGNLRAWQAEQRALLALGPTSMEYLPSGEAYFPWLG